jgi:membrane-bound lytic murein transglycosylase B
MAPSRVAALTAVAVLGGAAGVAAAGEVTSSDPACLDPDRATRIVTTPGGAVLDCEAPVDPVPSTTTQAPTVPEVPTADSPPPETTAAEPQSVTAAVAAVESAAVVTAETAPSPAADVTLVQAPAPAPAPAAGAPTGSMKGKGSKAKARPKHVEPTAARKARAKAKAKAKARAKVQAAHREQAQTQARILKRLRRSAGVPAERTQPRTGGASTSAAVYAALPPAWTSLAPIVLPAGDVEGFPIPPSLLPLFQAAAAQYGVPWEVLASINEIETDFGRNATVSSAGALGWMQFMPGTWARWGTDGDGDRRRDPRNPVDAIFAAARYLAASGAGHDLPAAVFAYNHSAAYVDQVVRRAREFAGLDATLVAALSWRALREDFRLYRARGNPFTGSGAVLPQAGQALLLSERQLTHLVLHSDDITIDPAGRLDIASGRVDRRVLATLLFLARSGLKPTVSCLQTGHSRLTSSGNVSAHSYGHAVDISAINGIPIMGHQGAGSITERTLRRLTGLQGYLRANQVISLMTIVGLPNTLALADHDDHFHVGFPRVPLVGGDERPTDVAKLVATFRARRR